VNRETNRYEAMLRDRLAKIRQEKLEIVGAGVDVDWYRNWTGYIRCLGDVMAIMTEVRKKIDDE
jgi:hypothetical protein